MLKPLLCRFPQKGPQRKYEDRFHPEERLLETGIYVRKVSPGLARASGPEVYFTKESHGGTRR